jgi:predicted outer membrane protein
MNTHLPIVAVGLAFAMAACAHDEPAQSPSFFAPSASSNAFTPVVSREDEIVSMEPVGPQNPTVVTVIEAGPAATPAETVAGAGDGGSLLSDEQILLITRTANESEVEQAELAHKKSRDGRVQKLAAQMVRDHTTAKDRGNEIAHKDSLTLEPSTQSAQMEREGAQTMRVLKSEEGHDFDKAYVDTQVREHSAVLEMLTDLLIPSSSGTDVRAYLHDLKASVEEHLDHAVTLKQAIEK